MKLVSWSRLVSANRWSINDHTKIVHQLLLTDTATLNRHHSCYLWWAPDATWSPGDEIKVKQFQPSLLNAKDIPRCTCTQITHLPIIAFPFHPEYSIDGNRWSENQSITARVVIDYQYQSINWYWLVLTDIDFIDWIPQVKCMIMHSFRTLVSSRLFTYMFLLYKHQWNTRWDFVRKHDILIHMWKDHRCYDNIINCFFHRKKLLKCCSGVWLPSWIT